MKLRELMSKTGPGLIVAATGLGAGDIIAASVAGARFGSVLLWAVIVGAILKFCLNEGLARWQLATGTTFLEGWINHLPRALSWYFLIYLLLWTFMVAAALMAATGLAAHAIFPTISVPVWGILHSVLAILVVLKGGYQFLEKIMKVFIGIMFICMMTCAVLVMPPLDEILKGLFLPALPNDSIIYVFGIIGGVGGSVTIMSYGYWMREAGWTNENNIGNMRIDLGIAYALTALFGFAIILVSAGIDVESISGNNMALAVANQLQLALGDYAKWVFLIGFWGAVFSSMIGVWHGVPYLFANFFYHFRGNKSELKETNSISKTPAYLGYLLYLSFLPMVLLALNKPVWIVIAYSVIGAFFMPLVAVLLLYMNGIRKWVGHHRNGILGQFFLLACLALFGALLWVKLQK